jgi:hypothetical protein
MIHDKLFLKGILSALLVFTLFLTGCDGDGETGPVTPDPDPNKVAMPTADPSGGAVASGTEITLATATAGADIYYTTDGSAPTATVSAANFQYSEDSKPRITGETTLKAIAVKTGMTNSDVLTAAYTISVGGNSDVPLSFTALFYNLGITFSGIVYGGEKFVAWSNQGTRMATSTDGVTWPEGPPPSAAAPQPQVSPTRAGSSSPSGLVA